MPEGGGDSAGGCVQQGRSGGAHGLRHFCFYPGERGGRGWRRFWDRPDGPCSSPRKLAHTEPVGDDRSGKGLQNECLPG